MLTASARALCPFFVRFSAPSPAWIARGARLASCLCAALQINLPLVMLLRSMYTAIRRRG
eukprot:COSAG03_NODE_160_length_11366_cov_10.057518_11_plen_60_part_00